MINHSPTSQDGSADSEERPPPATRHDQPRLPGQRCPWSLPHPVPNLTTEIRMRCVTTTVQLNCMKFTQRGQGASACIEFWVPKLLSTVGTLKLEAQTFETEQIPSQHSDQPYWGHLGFPRLPGQPHSACSLRWECHFHFLLGVTRSKTSAGTWSAKSHFVS